ncbi:MAG: septum formation initiator family protein [Candidatus Omnitrophica bacterium]|nr:septum formation initiator family protein [Candidatus Omnitrophota bacterium]
METRTRRRISLVLLGLGLLFGPGLFHLASLYLRERNLDRKLKHLEAQQEALVRERDRLKKDPTYVEGLIRSTFKVAKPGEVVIPLTNSPDDRPKH